MSVLRTIKCSKCGDRCTEKSSSEGWPGWGLLQGKKNEKGETDYHLCPKHLDMIFEFLSKES